jgi:hypothetical protein
MLNRVEPGLNLLRGAQNADGGWGYFPGKESWLEPTAYGLLALADESGSASWARGWRLVRSWELPDGGWRACAKVNEAHWATSLAVTLYSVAGIYDGPFERGVKWLTASTGAEGRPLSRLAHWMRPAVVEFNPAWCGWPWQPGTSSWIEPTAHALLALRCAAARQEHAAVAGRISTGERMLLERRCRDGGWNYGNRRVLGADLPSYPETTALALMALNGHASVQWSDALNHVERMWEETRSPLARAWLAACLLQYRGQRPGPPAGESLADANDILVAAIGAIAWDRVLPSPGQ